MKRNYKFDLSDNNCVIATQNIDENIRYNCNYMLQAACNLVKEITNCSDMRVEFLGQDTANDEIQFNFKVVCNDLPVFISLSDGISIKYLDKNYKFKIYWNNKSVYAVLTSSSKINENCEMTQIFGSHSLVIEAKYPNRKYSMVLPFESNALVSDDILTQITLNSNIIDLRKIYIENFYNKQSNYEKRSESTIAIYDMVGEEQVLIDKLVLSSGEVVSYVLGSRVDGTVLSINGGKNQNDEINIRNYGFYKSVDFNKELSDLYIRSRRI